MIFEDRFTKESLNWKPIAAGLIGGAVGTVAMRYYWQAVSRLSGEDPRQAVREDGGPLEDISVAGPTAKENESSTAAMGRIAYEKVEHEEPPKQTKQKLSQGVHWSYGTAAGGVYGALRARDGKAPDVLGGASWGTLMWLLGDELAVPLVGLAPGPTKYPVRQHAHRLGAHLTFGVAAALTAQSVRSLLD